MENINSCPVCEGTSLHDLKVVKDHFLSQEKFNLSQCGNCGFVFTNPRPGKNELAKYYQSDEYLSHSKKKNGLITFLYDLVKSISLRKKYNLITKNKTKGKILDIGCATGEFLNYFQKKGWHCTGIEPAQNPRNFAIENYHLDVKPENEIMQLDHGTYDVITMWHVLEHVSDLNERIQQIHKLLKADGLLVIALPNHLSYDAEQYKSFWAGYDVPRHLYHFSSTTISRLLSRHEFSVFKISPMKYDAYYMCLLSEKYKTGKLNYFIALLNGMKSNHAAKRQPNRYSSQIYLINKTNS
jgi:2-polyprenyl-3-methyl-5-hydroxy-6-metoxy-1,4-benzoquinol methylase